MNIIKCSLRTLSLLLAAGLAFFAAPGRADSPRPNLPPDVAAGYHLAWHDEFDGKTLDPTRWKPYFPNQKRAEGYNDPTCAMLDGHGHLVITVKPVDGVVHSAMVDTEGLFQAKFGYFECRARLQKQPGFWSAFWLESPHVSDPENGKGITDDTLTNGTEVDIFEYLPNKTEGYGSALHWNGYRALHKNVGHRAPVVPALSEGWHTFGVEWRPDGYTFYCDGRKTWESTAALSRADEFLILSAEVGSWAGDIKTAKLPDEVTYDYVRVYQKAPPRLHVVGNSLRNDKGETVRLQGVNIASLEWSNTGDAQLMQSLQVAFQDWNASIIRLPLCQDRWLGKAPGQTDGGTQYRQIVTGVVSAIAARQKYVLLDLHWSDAGQWGQQIAQHRMPDDNSTMFWQSLAPQFANNPAVLFDLYNEPRDVTWDVWQHGGVVTEPYKNKGQETTLTYHSPGMQGLLETIRATGAKNLVVAGGLDWAYDLTGIVHGHALRDAHGQGILYATHIYPWKKDWDAHVTVAAAKYPVFVGEVGCEPSRPGAPANTDQEEPATWAPKVIAYINQHQFSWTAWCFHPSASPCLLADWNYTPTSYWGVPVKQALMQGKSPTNPR